MLGDLLQLDDYSLMTFSGTAHALKAEKLLKTAEFDFMVIPTLREISSSCGLSVKLRPENVEAGLDILIAGGVGIDGVYHVKREGKQNHVSRIELP